MMKTPIISTLAICSLMMSPAMARTWTSADGKKTFEGEMTAYDEAADKVTVDMNGREMTFKTSILSADDIAYAKAEGFPIQEVDILQTPLTGTQIIELVDRLGIKVADLVNQNHPTYSTKFGKADLSSEDWIKMIQNNPEIMKQPIAIRGDITILVETPSDIIKI